MNRKEREGVSEHLPERRLRTEAAKALFNDPRFAELRELVYGRTDEPILEAIEREACGEKVPPLRLHAARRVDAVLRGAG